jgi:hypothetical protein
MTAKLFTGILDLKLIEKIESYQNSVKDSAFIARWMNRLNYRIKKRYLVFWQKLIRDSENTVI